MGLKLIFLIVIQAVSLLGLSGRESWWKDAEIMMLRYQLAVAERERLCAHSRLTWPDRPWMALVARILPIDRLAAMRLLVNPATILRWHRDIVRPRWSPLSRQDRCGRPPLRNEPGPVRWLVPNPAGLTAQHRVSCRSTNTSDTAAWSPRHSR